MCAVRKILGLVFIVAGVLHFVRPKPYEQMMPPWIPLHREAVLVSGVGEVLGGAALLDRGTARFGFWWLAALLVAVFPANVYMATDPEQIPWVAGRKVPRAALWARLPLQPLMILLLAVATRRS
jgi:uncharacterized membrane protein